MIPAEQRQIRENAISKSRDGRMNTTEIIVNETSSQNNARIQGLKSLLAYTEDDETDRQGVDLANSEIHTVQENSHLSQQEWDRVWNVTRSTVSSRKMSSYWRRSEIQQRRQAATRYNVHNMDSLSSARRVRRRSSGLSILPRLQLLHQTLRVIADDWNFKGFGWAFYKSLLIREACGVALRIPLSLNFASWDRNSVFVPYFSGSVGLYYPWMTSITLTCSMNVQLLRTMMLILTARLRLGLFFLMSTIIRTVAICTSSLLYPLTRLRMVLPERRTSHRSTPPQEPTHAAPSPSSSTDGTSTRSASHTHEQRIGMSWSWRFSLLQGFELRISYWHLYLQTILYVLQSVLAPKIDPLLKVWIEPPNPLSKVITPSLFGTFSDCLRRHTAAFGLSTSYPVHDLSKCSCSAMLSLSGFRFIKPRKQQSSSYSCLTTSAAATELEQTQKSKTFSTNWEEGNDASTNMKIDGLTAQESAFGLTATASENRKLTSMSRAVTESTNTSSRRVEPLTSTTPSFKVTS